MPAGQALNRLAPIDPSSLIGRADSEVVTPRATAALTDAFRQGFITADDIVSRVGQLGKAKKKAELTLAQEAVSPEAVAARAQGLGAATAQGALQQAQAEAGLPLVEPTAELKAQELELQKLRLRYPGLEDFEKYAPGEQVKTPTLADGSPDFPAAAKIGKELALHKARKDLAQAELKNIGKVVTDGRVVSVTDQGVPVSNARVGELYLQANQPFGSQENGSVQTAATVAGPSGPEADIQRAQRVNAAGITRKNVLQAIGTPEQPVVEPRGTSPTPETPSPDEFGYSLGGAAKPDIRPTDAQIRAQTTLARLGVSNDVLQHLEDSNYDPASIGSAIESVLPQFLKSENRKLYETASEAWAQGLLRLESGAAISAHEKSWYGKTFFPQVGDSAVVQEAKASLRHDLERQIADIATSGGVESPAARAQLDRLDARAEALNAEQSKEPTGRFGPTPIITLPSGKQVRRNSQGVLKEVK